MKQFFQKTIEAEFNSMYTTEMEGEVLSMFFDGKFDDAVAALNEIIEKNIGNCFMPYRLIYLRFRFMQTLLYILKEISCFEKGFSTKKLPQLDFEVYGKSRQVLKEELLSPFLILNDDKFSSAIMKRRIVLYTKNYVEQNMKKDISLSDIAAYIGLSESYISRIFPKLTGEKCMDYVRQKKVDYAKKLLLEGDSISRAIEKSGFLSRETFNRAFVKYLGVTPGCYCKEYIQQNISKREE